MVKQISLLLCIQEILGSNLVTETSYSNMFRLFYSAPKADVRTVSQIRPWPLSSTFFPIHLTLIMIPFDAT
jgi:hypothetical protein